MNFTSSFFYKYNNMNFTHFFSYTLEKTSFIYNYYTDIYTLSNNILIPFNIVVNILMLLSLVCAIYTILSKNPIISVLYLIGLYINIASYLIITGSQFIGLSYVLIYIGAISILFVFILMLINIRISELTNNSSNSISLIIVFAIILNYIVYNYIFNISILNNEFFFSKNDYYVNNYDIFNITNTTWDSIIIEYNTISSIGNLLYCNSFFIFFIASIILLLAMIGAIIITIKPIEKYHYKYNSNNKIFNINII